MDIELCGYFRTLHCNTLTLLGWSATFFSFRHARGVWRGFVLFDDLLVLYGGVVVPGSVQPVFTWTGTYLVALLVQDVGQFIRQDNSSGKMI